MYGRMEVLMDIIATIGNTCKGDELSNLVERLLNLNIDYFRFNLSKYDVNVNLRERLNAITAIMETYPVRIMLDMPIPNRKPRLLV